jgi:hypothetical protein
MRTDQAEGVGDTDDELAHRRRGQQRVAALGTTEPWQVDRHQMGTCGQPRPHGLERQQAFRPRAQQQGVILAVPAFGEPDRQPVDDPELGLDGCVQPAGHDVAPFPPVLSAAAIVMPDEPHSYRTVGRLAGQS